MSRTSAFVLCLAPMLCLTACTAASDYPSLARRPAERVIGSAPVVTPEASPSPPPAPPSPDLTARLAQLVDQANTAHRQFIARRGEAERLVASGSGSAVASESWSVASIALAGLESARSQAMIALAELDQLYAGESVQAAETGIPGNTVAIGVARDEVGSVVSEEDEVLARLRGKLAN